MARASRRGTVECQIVAPAPRSCDTFVALPTNPAHSVLFGKNSDRPDDEVQEVVAFPAAVHPPGAVVKCTYISIPQVATTLAVVLSKPCWMWGTEMGANSKGLVVGNEAVWTREPDDGPEALLGMDFVRLALERCSCAAQAVATIATLLEEHGQGGGCEEGSSWSYHNSFLIADREQAWVLETAGKWWAAEQVQPGSHRNISNCLSIRTGVHMHRSGLQEYAKQRGYWDGVGCFDWAAAFSSGPVPPEGRKSAGREAAGAALLAAAAVATAGSGLSAPAMMGILRDKDSGICMCGGGFRTTGSQVSVLAPPESALTGRHSPDVHWFTATPDPSRSCFKPFTFPARSQQQQQDGALPGAFTRSPDTAAAEGAVSHFVASPDTAAPAKKGDGCSSDRSHVLWREAEQAGAAASRNKAVRAALMQGLADVEARALAAVGGAGEAEGITFGGWVGQEREVYAAALKR